MGTEEIVQLIANARPSKFSRYAGQLRKTVRVFIVEPSAVALDRSHAAKSIIGHTQVLQSAGISVEWITNIHSVLQFERTPNYRALPYTIYDDVRTRRTSLARRLRYLSYWSLVRRTLKQLKTVLDSNGASDNDHLFVPTTDWILLQAIFQLVRDVELRKRFPILHLLIMYENANWMTGGYPYEKLVQLLRQFPVPIHVYTETRRHATRLSVELGQQVYSYPFPCIGEMDSKHDAGEEYRVGFLGGGRRDKGYQLIPGIVERFQRLEPKHIARFIVQTPRPEDGLEKELEALKRFGNVSVLENRISEQAYRDMLGNCAIMVFPYQQEIYHSRGSAIVNEAVAHGIPIVCTRDTSLEEMLERGNGLSATGKDEFAEALSEILSNYDGYLENARKMAVDYQDKLKNSPLIRNIKRTNT